MYVVFHRLTNAIHGTHRSCRLYPRDHDQVTRAPQLGAARSSPRRARSPLPMGPPCVVAACRVPYAARDASTPIIALLLNNFCAHMLYGLRARTPHEHAGVLHPLHASMHTCCCTQWLASALAPMEAEQDLLEFAADSSDPRPETI